MNAITRTSTNSRSPAPIADRSARDALDVARNLLFRDYPAMPAMLREPLSPALRATLEHRSRGLSACLAPAAKSEHSKMASAITALLGGFGGVGSGSVEAVVSLYVEGLKDLPLWAVVAACTAITRGEVEGASLDFRPAVPRLRQAARALMAPWDEEMFHLREVLRAEAMAPEDEEMRKRVGVLLTEFSSDLKMGKFRQAVTTDEADKTV